MLAVARDTLIATPTGPRRADVLARGRSWQRLSCGNGAEGRRWYDWALFATHHTGGLAARPPFRQQAL